jgi:hypothetical protein
VIAAQLVDMVEANPQATRIVLSPRKLAELKKELSSCCVYPTRDYFLDLPIVTERPGLYCRNCGATLEPVICSYCKTPSEIIELQD